MKRQWRGDGTLATMMNLLGKLFIVLVIKSAPGRGGGGRGGGSRSVGGKSNSSSGLKRSGYYLHGGLYPVSRTVKDAPVKTPIYRGIGAWGIIGIILGVSGLCCGIYYALYLCDLHKRTDNYSSNLATQVPHLLTDKPKPEENGNGNIPMTDKNELVKTSSMKNGLNSEVFL